MTDGYRALRETAGRIELSSHGRIRVTGEDRARLLHAMTTNHIQGLVAGAGCYAFFLSAVGRVLADANILCFDDHFLLDVEPESRAFLLEHLDKYIIADDVALEDITAATAALGIEGPDAAAVLRDAGLPMAVEPLQHLTAGPLTIVRASSTGAPGFRIFGPASALPPLPAVPSVSPDDARTVRLEHGFPRFGDDITSANLPGETAITDVLHFSKGCYIGQEIVERVRSRGHVNRILTGIRSAGTEPYQKGTKVSFEGSEAGEVTSSAYSPGLAGIVGLAYLRVNAAKPGDPLMVEGRAAQAVAIKSSRT
jgi:aminomethyltransferase